MITRINNSDVENFNGINSIVFYEDNSVKKILHKYSDNKIIDSDFIEYGITELIKKSKFNSDELINYLDEESKEIIGNNPDDLSKIEDNYFLPTNSNSASSTDPIYGYFGSKTIQKNVLIVVKVPENIDFVCLRSEIGLKLDNTGDKDNYTIQLELTPDEIPFNKVIFITLTLETYNTPKLNLTYNIWRDDNNANQNKPKYSLRNDEFFSTLNNINLIEEKDNRILFDKSSGSILSYEEVVENTPILNKKINRWKNNKKYNPKTVYKLGDVVEFGRDEENKPYEYISLRNNNVGNTPCFSSKWILSNKFNDYLTTKVNINVDPEGAANIEPNGFFSLAKDATECKFQLTCNPGYVIDYDNLAFIGNTNISNQSTSQGNEHTSEVIFTTSKDDTDSNGWRQKLLKERTITFKLRGRDYTIYISDVRWISKIEYSEDGGDNWTMVELNNQTWSEYLSGNQNKFTFSNLKGGNILIRITYQPGFSSYDELIKPVIASGKLENGSEGSKTIQIINENGSYYFIDKLSFIDRTNYQVSITKVKHQVHITGGLKYLEIDKIFIEETHGNPFTFRFYKDTNYPQTSAECDEKGFWYNPKVYLGTSFIQMIDNGSESVCYNPGNIPFNMTKTKITVNGNVVDLYTVTCNSLNGDLDIKIETKKNDN